MRPRIAPTLAARLEGLRRTYGPALLASDPVRYVHRFRRRDDREIAGWIASALAFGRVAAIFRSVEAVLDALGPRPAAVVRTASREQLARRLRGFRHRWVDGRDLADALSVLGSMQDEHGSLEPCFRPAPRATDLGSGIERFAAEARARSRDPTRRGFAFLFPTPATGSACKRANLYLRWMVRDADGVDLGLWPGLDRARLIVPLDVHVAFLGRVLGLTRRRTPGWTMACDITRALGTLDAEDPVKYDWALSRLGILGRCKERPDAELCPACPLLPHCRLVRRRFGPELAEITSLPS